MTSLRLAVSSLRAPVLRLHGKRNPPVRPPGAEVQSPRVGHLKKLSRLRGLCVLLATALSFMLEDTSLFPCDRIKPYRILSLCTMDHSTVSVWISLHSRYDLYSGDAAARKACGHKACAKTPRTEPREHRAWSGPVFVEWSLEGTTAVRRESVAGFGCTLRGEGGSNTGYISPVRVCFFDLK